MYQVRKLGKIRGFTGPIAQICINGCYSRIIGGKSNYAVTIH
jgi:hypothetical protein